MMPATAILRIMVVWFGWKQKAKRVPGGEEHKRKCPECEKTTVFREAVAKREYTAYHFVKLWESDKTVFVCDGCGEAMDLDDTLEPDSSPRERAKLEKLRLAEQRAAEANREEARKRFEAQQRAQSEAIEDELADMKKRLGLK